MLPTLVTLALVALAIVALAIWLFAPTLSSLARRPPEVGDPAPGFRLRDATGTLHTLDDHASRWRVLYFYPRDDTPGCTREACALRDAHLDFSALDAEVLGVSVDSPERHAAFTTKHRLPFTLLSDPDGATASAYGSLIRLGPWHFARRRSFLIAPDGRIAARYLKVDPASHAATLLAELNPLREQHRLR